MELVKKFIFLVIFLSMTDMSISHAAVFSYVPQFPFVLSKNTESAVYLQNFEKKLLAIAASHDVKKIGVQSAQRDVDSSKFVQSVCNFVQQVFKHQEMVELREHVDKISLQVNEKKDQKKVARISKKLLASGVGVGSESFGNFQFSSIDNPFIQCMLAFILTYFSCREISEFNQVLGIRITEVETSNPSLDTHAQSSSSLTPYFPQNELGIDGLGSISYESLLDVLDDRPILPKNKKKIRKSFFHLTIFRTKKE